MNDLSTERLLFEDIQGKKIEVDFDGGQVISDAGVLLLREVERRLGLIRRIARIIRDRRHPGRASPVPSSPPLVSTRSSGGTRSSCGGNAYPSPRMK